MCIRRIHNIQSCRSTLWLWISFRWKIEWKENRRHFICLWISSITIYLRTPFSFTVRRVMPRKIIWFQSIASALNSGQSFKHNCWQFIVFVGRVGQLIKVQLACNVGQRLKCTGSGRWHFLPRDFSHSRFNAFRDDFWLHFIQTFIADFLYHAIDTNEKEKWIHEDFQWRRQWRRRRQRH